MLWYLLLNATTEINGKIRLIVLFRGVETQNGIFDNFQKNGFLLMKKSILITTTEIMAKSDSLCLLGGYKCINKFHEIKK